MRRSQLSFLTLALAMAAMSGSPVYGASRRSRVMSDEYKRERAKKLAAINGSVTKELHEFTVEGKKVMAYSKKDALKRFGTKKSKKSKKR